MRDLKRFVASRSGRLPTVGDVPPYGIIGVSPSKYLERDPDPPYIRRDIDERLDEAIVKQRFLLLVGHSKAGKSRSAFEATRRLFPTSTLVVPFSSTRSLAQLIRDPPFDADSPLPVLWLDELDRYLGDASGVDRALVDECTRGDRRMVVVGTISRRWRDRLVDTPGAIGSATRAVLEQASQVELPNQLSARELAEAERRYPDDAFGRDGRGIGEQAVLAHELERRYELGPAAVASLYRPRGRAGATLNSHLGLTPPEPTNPQTGQAFPLVRPYVVGATGFEPVASPCQQTATMMSAIVAERPPPRLMSLPAFARVVESVEAVVPACDAAGVA